MGSPLAFSMLADRSPRSSMCGIVVSAAGDPLSIKYFTLSAKVTEHRGHCDHREDALSEWLLALALCKLRPEGCGYHLGSWLSANMMMRRDS